MNERETTVLAFRRAMLETGLAQCTTPQREFFGRIFPAGVPVDRLDTAIDLVHRTVAKNEKG